VEQERLFDLVRSLAAEGVSIVYVSHRMDEVFELADRMVVLREGRNAGVFDRSEADHAAIIGAMLGGELTKELGQDRLHRTPPRTGAPAFRVRHFHTRGVQDVTLDVEAGEVVGLYGVVEAGCGALLEGLFGARPWAGAMELDGRPISPRSPTDARGLGIALVPSDHRRRGLVPSWPVGENMLLGRGTWRGDFLRRISADLKRRLTEILGLLRVNTWGLDQSVDELSGGTQQKVVVARWLVDTPRLLLLDDPTRGIDVGAKADIYELLRGLRDQGVAALLHSSELTELVSVADRVLVMRDGAIRGELSGRDLDRQQILFLATHA
jgi:ribose transport system ATP-binding protein